MKSFVVAALGAVLCLLAPLARAEENGQGESAESERVTHLYSRNFEAAEGYRLDLTVPESPAFAVLGLDSPEVATPRDTPALWADLANLFGDNGELKTGGAITAQPYWLGTRRITIDQYQADNRKLERALLARTRISVASAAVPDVEDAVRVGIGATFEPLDFLDPRVDRLTEAEKANGEVRLDACINTETEILETYYRRGVREEIRALDPELTARAENGDEDAQAKITQMTSRIVSARRAEHERIRKGDGTADVAAFTVFEQHVDGCVAQWRARQARRPNLLIAIGQTFMAETGQYSDLESESATVWVGYSHPLAINGLFPAFDERDYTSRLNLYARYAESETVATGEDTTAEAAVAVAAVSLSLSRNRNWQFGVESSYRYEEFEDGTADREFAQIALNTAFRLNEQMWIRASYGTRGDDESEFARISLVFAEKAEN